MLQVVGWGINEHDKPSDELYVTYLQFIRNADCLNTAAKEQIRLITWDKFCAINETAGTMAVSNKKKKLRFNLQGMLILLLV